jgi:hydroxyacylglutathione hydrolase
MQKVIAIPALKDNYIWLLMQENSIKAWVVDPGDAAPVIKTLNQYQLSLSGILLTHHHFDHCNGVSELLNYFGKCPVVGSHKNANPYISDAVKENDTVPCVDYAFKVIEIPGHTLDHIAYYGNNHLFCGDTLFSAGCGRIFEGTPEMMSHSLKKLLQLPDETNVYCGHEYTLGNLVFAKHVEPNNKYIQEKITIVENILREGRPTLPSTLREEKNINPFLRCDVKEIVDAVEKFSGKKLKNTVAVFSFLREWKNNFK